MGKAFLYGNGGENIDTSDGTITPSNVLSGKIGYSKGSKIIGEMKNYGTLLDDSIGGLNSNYPNVPLHRGVNPNVVMPVKASEPWFAISPPSGYWTKLGSYAGIPQSELASKIGLTSDKIVSGNTILGIAGTGHRYAYGNTNSSYTRTNIYMREHNSTQWNLLTSHGYFSQPINVPFTPSIIRITIVTAIGNYTAMYHTGNSYNQVTLDFKYSGGGASRDFQTMLPGVAKLFDGSILKIPYYSGNVGIQWEAWE